MKQKQAFHIRSNVLIRYNGTDSHVEIPFNVKIIGQDAFRDCKTLRSITLPDNLEQIHSNAFYNCSALEQITFGSQLQQIDEKAFRGCTSLTDINLPASLRYIGPGAFLDAAQRLTLYDNIEKIGNYAFSCWQKKQQIIVHSAVDGSDEERGTAQASFIQNILYRGCPNFYSNNHDNLLTAPYCLPSLVKRPEMKQALISDFIRQPSARSEATKIQYFNYFSRQREQFLPRVFQWDQVELLQQLQSLDLEE